MRRSSLNKIGKVGIANISARNKIANIAEEKGLNYCELQLSGCLKNMYLAPAHRHLRSYYKGDEELLADFKQWVVGCQHCHTILDSRSQTTQGESDEIFTRLRGEE